MEETKEENNLENEKKDEKTVSLWKSLKRDKNYRGKFVNTLILWWSFVCLGWQIGQGGPSLLDIQFITRTSLEKASATFTAGSVGYLAASLGTGFIIGKVNTKVILILSCILAAAMTAAIPWCSIYELMICANLIRGAANGMQDTAGNTFLLRMWGSDCKSYMQALHFAFAFGGIISPLVTAPFLLPEENTSHSESMFGNITTIAHVTVFSHQRSVSKPTESRLYLAFITTTVFYISAAIFILISYLRNRKQDYVTQYTSEEKTKELTMPLKLKVVLIVILLVMMWMYVSVEGSFTGFLATFVVKELKWSKVDGSYITSVFWATFSFGRFSGIFVVMLIRPHKVLIIYAFLLALSVTGVMVTSLYAINTGVWICVGISGFACSVIFPSIFTWIEEDLITVTGKITSLFIVASATSGMIQPLLLGFLMDNITPMYFTYIPLGQCTVVILTYVIVKFLSLKVKKYRRSNELVI